MIAGMTFLAPWLQVLGLCAGFAAALLLGIAQQSPGRGIAQGCRDEKGREHLLEYAALRYPRLWRGGLGLLVAGFVLQLVGYGITEWVGGY